MTRLVEDAIYDFEQNLTQPTALRRADERPHFYSLQFDMLEHTPEIFAARGLVALRPPFFAAAVHGKSISLSVALGELLDAQQSKLYQDVALDDDLQQLATRFSDVLGQALKKLESHSIACRTALGSGNCAGSCAPVLHDLGSIATQGVYLVDQNGTVRDCALPTGLDQTSRMTQMPTFLERPYFRIAKSFREPFVSDSFASIFNGNATAAFCVPLIESTQFRGLLFAATQIGSWLWPVDEARAHWQKERSVLLLDANGVALFPPNQEIAIKEGRLKIPTESLSANRGYWYDELFALSRRDALIKHIVENIVPLSQDDDVFELGGDFEYYSVVTEIPKTRWKLAIAKPTIKS